MTKIKFTPAQNQWLEVTWTDVEQLPDVVTPAKPALYDADGKEVQAATPETTTPGGEKRTELKHTSYHPTQLDMLKADIASFGMGLAPQHETMLNEWVASYVAPETPLYVRTKTDVLKELAALDVKSIRALRERNEDRLDSLDQAVKLREELSKME